MTTGFIKLNRSSETLELLNDPNAFILLTVIALRARRTEEFNLHNLRSGEALIGDHRKYGLTRREYRTAMKHLEKWGFATFRSTTRGTVARLCDTRIYDINEIGDGQQTAIKGPTGDQRAATNKNEKKEKKEKNKRIHAEAWRLCELLWNLIQESKPDFRKPSLESWAGDIDRMIRLDGRSAERIEAVIRWCRKDPFWSSNILSAAKLRKHFDRLELEMARHTSTAATESTQAMIERMDREGTL